MTFLSIVFMVLMLLHVAHSVFANTREEDPPNSLFGRIHLAIQSPLFILAFIYAWQHGAFSRQLVSPLYIGLGLLAGHLVFGLSLLATHRCIEDSWSHFFDFGSVWNYTFDSPVILTRFLGVAVIEELIWRVTAQGELIRHFGHPGVVIVLIAILFSVVHRHFFRNSKDVSIEFVLFALLLGVLYWATDSLILVIVIHAVRDIEIAYIEYLIKCDEIGDAELAARAVEKSFFRTAQQ